MKLLGKKKKTQRKCRYLRIKIYRYVYIPPRPQLRALHTFKQPYNSNNNKNKEKEKKEKEKERKKHNVSVEKHTRTLAAHKNQQYLREKTIMIFCILQERKKKREESNISHYFHYDPYLKSSFYKKKIQ